MTFECDYPPEVRDKRVIVDTRLSETSDPAAIDREVREFVARGEGLYEIDAEGMRELDPDVVLTQELCDVCAATPGDLASALSVLDRKPEIVSLHPHSLEDVWNDVVEVGSALGVADAAAALVSERRRAIQEIEAAVRSVASRPRVACLEWLSPPFSGGHWVPEMVERAGGIDVLSKPGERSRTLTWSEIQDAAPDVLVVMPCGSTLDQTIESFRALELPEEWSSLPAVQNGRVYAVDANGYFSRPAPRLATGVAILGHVLHPESVPWSGPAHAFERL